MHKNHSFTSHPFKINGLTCCGKVSAKIKKNTFAIRAYEPKQCWRLSTSNCIYCTLREGALFALMITRTCHIFLEFCPCFYRFCEFTRTPKNCIIEGNETVFPCAHVQPCESDSNNCQSGEVFVSTVQIDSWVSQGRAFLLVLSASVS